MQTGSWSASKWKDGSESGTASILCRSTALTFYVPLLAKTCQKYGMDELQKRKTVEQVMSHSMRHTWLRKFGKFSLGLIIEKIVFSLKKPTVRCFPLSDKKVLRLRIQIWPYDYNSNLQNMEGIYIQKQKLAISEFLSAQHCTRDCLFLPAISVLVSAPSFTRDFCTCITSILYPRFLFLYQLNPVSAISVLVSAKF